MLASAERLSTWVVRDADFFGFDPHFYDWPTASFQAQVDNVVARMAEAGVGGRPFIINTGGVEDPDDPNAKARWIPRRCALGCGRTGCLGSCSQHGGSRRGREWQGCGRTVRQFAPIARGLPDVLRRRVTHPGTLTGGAKWFRGRLAPHGGAVLQLRRIPHSGHVSLVAG